MLAGFADLLACLSERTDLLACLSGFLACLSGFAFTLSYHRRERQADGCGTFRDGGTIGGRR